MLGRSSALLLYCLLGLGSGLLLAGAPVAHAQSRPAGLPREPGTLLFVAPAPAPGTCLGGSCVPHAGARPSERAPVRAAGPRSPASADSSLRRARFARTGAVLGTVTAGLLLGGAIAIALVDDPDSERITRGVWVSTLALTTPLVALSAHRARKVGHFKGYRGVRRLGWFAYGLAVSDGAFLWASTFTDLPSTRALTIAAGSMAVLALLPHALDALLAARAVRTRRFVSRIEPSASGLRVRF